MLPDDLGRWLDANFSVPDARLARELLEAAVDHTGAAASERLLRCAAVGSRGELQKVRDLVEHLKVDYRDVILAGEYDVVDGKLVRVRNLTERLP
jgi:hypothetical protein